ncbi:MAG TPA: hypothetical protein VGM39_18855 [Kofleriaceae bacterium]|jgi:hypothetical protein
MLKTLAAIALSVGMTACLDNPSDEADPQPDNAGDTQPAETSDHQDPSTLGTDPLQDPEQPETNGPNGVAGCVPSQNEDNAGQHFKTTDTPGEDNQCPPLAG